MNASAPAAHGKSGDFVTKLVIIQSISIGYENVVTKSVGYERVWLRRCLVTKSPAPALVI